MPFIEFDKKFPDLMNKLESKVLKQSLRVSLNKALGAANKVAKGELRNRYNLPTKGDSESPLKRPPINTQLEKDPIRGIGGIDQKIPAKIKARDKQLGLIKFMNSGDQVPKKQKGIKVKQRDKVAVKVGKRGSPTTFRTRFVAKANNATHVFRRIKGTKSPNNPKKEKLAIQRLSSVFNVLKRKKTQAAMEKAATNKMAEVWDVEVKKRIDKELAKGGNLKI